MSLGDHASRRTGARLPYMPALDGLRAVAVVAVLLFHSDFGWAIGGHLGVTTFFTLSGFLITSLLLMEKEATGTIGLRAFWARRARRLVPAIVVCFALIAAVVALAPAAPSRGLVGDALSAATWMANWRFILAGRTYADLFALPSPFQHFWSLAIEEQFYALFPLLALVVMRRRTTQARRTRFAVVLSLLIVASTIQAARLYTPDGAIARAYYGTDARVAEILVGALLALALIGPRGVKTFGRVGRRAVSFLGVVGVVGLGAAFNRLDDHNPHLYAGGFLAVSLCVAAIIAAATQSGSSLGRVLATRPLVALGKISYGTYLFHWPIFILLTAHSTGLTQAPLFATRVGVTLALAGLSYVLIEGPVRHGSLPSDLALPGWVSSAVAGIGLIALVAGQTVLTTTVGAAEVAGSGGGVLAAPKLTRGAHAESTTATDAVRATGAVRSDSSMHRLSSGPVGFFDDPSSAAPPTVPVAPSGSLRVSVVGDSLGANLGTGLSDWANGRTDVVVQNLAVPACPISRGGTRRLRNGDPDPVSPACGWWDDPSSNRYAALQQFHPNVVVVQDGGNEIFDRKLPQWADWRQPEDPRFDVWLKNEYQTAFSRWGSYGAKIVVTNAPCGDWQKFTAFPQDSAVRVQALNQSVYNGLTNVTSADLFQRICPNGQYSDNVEGIQDGRPDGYHLSEDAATALAQNWLGPIVLKTGSQPAPQTLPVG